jgi:hypothetical protein
MTEPGGEGRWRLSLAAVEKARQNDQWNAASTDLFFHPCPMRSENSTACAHNRPRAFMPDLEAC